MERRKRGVCEAKHLFLVIDCFMFLYYHGWLLVLQAVLAPEVLVMT
jgi:hypothetical protein